MYRPHGCGHVFEPLLLAYVTGYLVQKKKLFKKLRLYCLLVHFCFLISESKMLNHLITIIIVLVIFLAENNIFATNWKTGGVESDKIYSKPEKLNFDEDTEIGNTVAETSELTVYIRKEILLSCENFHSGSNITLAETSVLTLNIRKEILLSCENFHSGSNITLAETSVLTLNIRKEILLSCENFHSGSIYSIPKLPTTFNQIQRLVKITDQFEDLQISFDLFDRKPCPLDSWVRW